MWLVVGTILRLTHLTTKPLWIDEFATIVFSLGHSFQAVPLNQLISLDTLLQPVQLDPQAGVGDVIHYLLSESTHPPLYFVLAHLWMQMFPAQGDFVSLWVVRSLPAFLGAASIPAMFGLGWLAFRSRGVGQLAAATMAVSPYGIFLAQEARHYTLAVLWVIGSLCCLVVATRTIKSQSPVPVWLGLLWVGINSLGMATHYFFGLTLCAEALVLLVLGVVQHWQNKQGWLQPYWWRIYAIAAGTAAGCLVWLPFWRSVYGSDLTQWIYTEGYVGLGMLEPIFQALGTGITMLIMLPVQAAEPSIVLASYIGMIVFLIGTLYFLIYGLKVQWRQAHTRFAVQVLAGFVLAALSLFFALTYGLGADLMIGERYYFVYFPAVIALVGASLDGCWKAAQTKVTRQSSFRGKRFWLRDFRINHSKRAVVLIWLIALIGSLTVVENLAYQKTNRPDLAVQTIQQVSRSPILIAMPHKNLGQTGRLMSLAWEFKSTHSSANSMDPSSSPRFLLVDQDQAANNLGVILQKMLTSLPRPLDLWLINFSTPVALEADNCLPHSLSQSAVDGYTYHLYRCLAAPA